MRFSKEYLEKGIDLYKVMVTKVGERLDDLHAISEIMEVYCMKLQDYDTSLSNKGRQVLLYRFKDLKESISILEELKSYLKRNMDSLQEKYDSKEYRDVEIELREAKTIKNMISTFVDVMMENADSLLRLKGDVAKSLEKMHIEHDEDGENFMKETGEEALSLMEGYLNKILEEEQSGVLRDGFVEAVLAKDEKDAIKKGRK